MIILKDNLLFVGYVMPADSNDYAFSVAGNMMQINIIKAIMKKYNVELSCIPQMASFPKTKKIFVNKSKKNITKDISSSYVGFINIPVIKQLCQIVNLYFDLCRQIKKKRYTKIVCFNNNLQTSVPLKLIRKKFKGEIIVVLADPPVSDSLSHKISNIICKNMLLSYDKYVLLNEYCVKYYGIKNPYIIVDGGIEVNENIKKESLVVNNRNILYTGALTYYSGILQLIKAALALKDKEVNLLICGKGELSDEISTISKNEPNIKYLGVLDRDEILSLQRESYLLVNPRNTEDEIAKVTFPSKTFEYLLSGRPVLSTKLNCYGEEYMDKMFFVEKSDYNMFVQKIAEILEINPLELKKMGENNIDWVIKQKNWLVQGERIVNFINE